MTSENTGSSASNGVPGAQLIIDLTQTDLPLGTPVYVYIVGLVVSTYYRIDTAGNPKEMALADNTIPANTFPGMNELSKEARTAISPNYPSSWADYSIPVEVGSNLILNLGNINTQTIPGLGTGTSAFSGRIYFSVGVPKLPFTVQQSGYTAPVFGNGSGVPGSLCLYDWIEFSYDSEGNFNGNTTQVNQFGFPLVLTGTTTDGTTYPSQGALNTSRPDIMKAIASQPAPFGNTGVMVAVPSGGETAYPLAIDYLRAISPVTVSGAGTSMNTYFDADLTTAYAAWQTTPLVTNDPSTGHYTGVVFPTKEVSIPTPANYPVGSIAFYQGNYATMKELAKVLSEPNPPSPAFFLKGSAVNTITSNDIWQCANSLASGGPAQKNVGKMIGAAFNRGMVVSANQTVVTQLDDSTCSGQAGSFYAAGTTCNQWSSWFHQYNSNGLAYGFPYDDVCDQNPSIPPSGKTLVASFIRIALGTFFS